MKKIITILLLILMVFAVPATTARADITIEPIGPWLEPLPFDYITHSQNINWGQPGPKPRFLVFGYELTEGVDFEYLYSAPGGGSSLYSDYRRAYASGTFKVYARFNNRALALQLHDAVGGWGNDAYDEYIPLDTFVVYQADMSKVTYDPFPKMYYQNGSTRPEIKNLYYNGYNLDLSEFYSYYDFEEKLDKTITVGPYNFNTAFKGTLQIPYHLEPGLLTNDNTKLISRQGPIVYKGSDIRPNFAIEINGYNTSGSNYDLVFSNNRDAGTATVTITGKNCFTGSVTKTFTIEPRDISECDISVNSVLYTGKPVGAPEVNITYGNNTIQAGDYDVTIGTCVNYGEYPVTITGKNNLKGSVQKTFKIEGTHISACDHNTPRIEYDHEDIIKDMGLKVTFQGKTLELKKDYTFTYYAGQKTVGKNPLFIIGTGDYSGKIDTYFEVFRDISKLKCVVKDATYTGKEIKPSIVLTDGIDEVPVDSKNFKVTYKNNTNVGTASFTIEGKGYYYGKVSGTFKIVAGSATPTAKPGSKPASKPVITPSGDPKTSIMDFVKRIYIYVLDREPEAEGAAFWSDELYSFRRTGAEVAQGFIFSPEFEARGTSDEEFVTILYNTFFGRKPEAEGLDFWLNELSSGNKDRVAVANGFIYSQEWADTCASYGIRSGGDLTPTGSIAPTSLTYAFVERMYTTALGRSYDEEGRQYWASALANFEVTGEAVGAFFFLSDEMNSYGLSDADYLNRLYATFMNREPDADGSAYWLSVLGSGTSRAEVVMGFTRSPEFTDKCVEARILPY